MELRIDKRIYSDACVSKTVYSLAKSYIVKRNLIDYNTELLTITPISHEDDKCIEAIFLAALNDYKLRQIIEEETHDIRTILYAKAFADFDDIDEDEI